MQTYVVTVWLSPSCEISSLGKNVYCNNDCMTIKGREASDKVQGEVGSRSTKNR